MADKETGEIMLNAVGQAVADVLGKTPDDVFVFIEAGDNWIGGGIFENLEDHVAWREPSDELDDLIVRLWKAAPAEKKWSVLLYDIKDGKFSVEYLYPETQIDEDGEEYCIHGELLDDALLARYGDKPVIYPEPDEGFWHELTEEDLAEIEFIEEDEGEDVDDSGGSEQTLPKK